MANKKSEIPDNFKGRMKRLKTLGDVRRAYAWVFNALNRGDLSPQVSGQLTYILNGLTALLKHLEDSQKFQVELELLKKKVLSEEVL